MKKDYCLLCGQEMYPPLLDEVNDFLKDRQYLEDLIAHLQVLLKRVRKEELKDEVIDKRVAR